MKNRPKSVRFNLNQIKDHQIPPDRHLEGDKVKYHRGLNSTNDWITALLKFNFHNGNEIKTLFKKFNLIETSDTSSHTHAGLIHYFHYCWAKEYGCVLRPDMIWYTIVSNFVELVLKFPEKFRSLFTDSPEKKDIILPEARDWSNTKGMEDLILQFDLAIRDEIYNKEFYNTICNISFE